MPEFESPVPERPSRKATDDIRALILHVEFKLELLPESCANRGLSPQVEATLRGMLEQELADLRALGPDITYPEFFATGLGEAHFANQDIRYDIATANETIHTDRPMLHRHVPGSDATE